MLPHQDILKYGGKAAILLYLARKLPDLPIPPFEVKEAGQDIDTFISRFRSMRKPVIVRSSSPYEYGDFEGIFESVRDVHDQASLEQAIKTVEGSATSERAREYARQNGFAIDSMMHVVIQEQSSSEYSGAMMRHPNNPDLLFINCYLGRGRFEQKYYNFVFNTRTREKADNGVVINKLPLEDASFLADQYQRVESLTELTDGEVLYVEFGLHPFALYQARPFKKIETADFEIHDSDKKSSLWTDLAFGITPPEGIVYPVLRSVGANEMEIAIDSACQLLLGSKPSSIHIEYGDEEMIEWGTNMMNLKGMNPLELTTRNHFAQMMKYHHATFDTGLGEPYCFLTSSAKREDYDVDLTIPSMKALVLGQAQTFLTHGLMRLIKKADLTFAFGPALIASDLYKKTKTGEDKIRIISNGKEALAMRE